MISLSEARLTAGGVAVIYHGFKALRAKLGLAIKPLPMSLKQKIALILTIAAIAAMFIVLELTTKTFSRLFQ